ncbi:uncharacterized protein A4U43_C06F16020 [Asparagus officinalis]|uniref:Uncharacterized protein n=1 Tax=Asparagus officinalis TaxID=4686 RepID=A0A5P1EQQ3_ASPOF|nr:uncharacterized protein A4U43_C06F16020 [Asparagus officinalis]
MGPKSCPRYEGESKERPFILECRTDTREFVLESRVEYDKVVEQFLLPADEALLCEIPNTSHTMLSRTTSPGMEVQKEAQEVWPNWQLLLKAVSSMSSRGAKPL